MHPTLKTVLYAIGVFSVFTVFAVILKLVTGYKNTDDAYFGLVTNNDLLMGLAVALVVTLNHIRRKNTK